MYMYMYVICIIALFDEGAYLAHTNDMHAKS